MIPDLTIVQLGGRGGLQLQLICTASSEGSLLSEAGSEQRFNTAAR